MNNAPILQVAAWHTRDMAIELRVARTEAVCLAHRIGELDAQIKDNTSQVTELIKVSESKALPELKSVWPVVAAVCMPA